MITGFDHIVLNCANVFTTVGFYERVLKMESRESADGKWSLHFGAAKISLQSPDTIPEIARNTTPGSANFCVVTEEDIADVVKRLQKNGVPILQGPGLKSGALGPMQSVYFRDPDGNLVEVCQYG